MKSYMPTKIPVDTWHEFQLKQNHVSNLFQAGRKQNPKQI